MGLPSNSWYREFIIEMYQPNDKLDTNPPRKKIKKVNCKSCGAKKKKHHECEYCGN